MDSITSTLGIGSGIDTKTLVSQLVAAQYDTKKAALTAKSEMLGAQVSSLAQLKSGLSGFSSALAALVGSGQLTTQPTSSDYAAVGVSALASAKLGALSTEIEVRQLATNQIVTSQPFASSDAAVGTGTLTVTLGTATYAAGVPTGFVQRAGSTPIAITIAAGENSLAGIARAINAANAGVTASIVGDGAGATLSIKGANGADAGFRIDVAEDGGAPGLSALSFNPAAPTMTLARAAQNSIAVVDGVTVSRAGNVVSDLIPGVRLDLLKAEGGKSIAIGSARPTAAIGQAVSDFVAAFNELRGILKTETDPSTGVLSGDVGARSMARQLGSLTSTPLTSAAIAEGAPRTLAEIGVRTNRDGTLSIDSARLNAAITAYPDAVEAMFNPSQSSDSPLLGIVSQQGKTPPGSFEVADIVVAAAGSAQGAARPDAFLTPIVIDGSNNGFNLTVNGGTAIDVTIADGSYASGADFAAALSASGVSFAWANDALVVTSLTKGANSAVTFQAVDATLNDRIGLSAPTLVAGRDGSGTIAGKPANVINGFFFAAADSAAAGLILQPTGDVASARIVVDLGLAAALDAVARRLTATGEGLSASETRYAKQQAQVAIDQAKATESAEQLRERLTRQFASMDIRVAAYKATQSFLEQQVDLWSADR
jgi:flagellar hook-associated protein 2